MEARIAGHLAFWAGCGALHHHCGVRTVFACHHGRVTCEHRQSNRTDGDHCV